MQDASAWNEEQFAEVLKSTRAKRAAKLVVVLNLLLGALKQSPKAVEESADALLTGLLVPKASLMSGLITSFVAVTKPETTVDEISVKSSFAQRCKASIRAQFPSDKAMQDALPSELVRRLDAAIALKPK